MTIDDFWALHKEEIEEAKKDVSDTALKSLFHDWGMECFERGYEEANAVPLYINRLNGR